MCLPSVYAACGMQQSQQCSNHNATIFCPALQGCVHNVIVNDCFSALLSAQESLKSTSKCHMSVNKKHIVWIQLWQKNEHVWPSKDHFLFFPERDAGENGVFVSNPGCLWHAFLITMCSWKNSKTYTWSLSHIGRLFHRWHYPVINAGISEMLIT